MKICPKCNEEFAQYVELCPNCGKMLRTIQQVKKQEPKIYIDPNKIGNQQKLVLKQKEKPQTQNINNQKQNSFEKNFDNVDELNALVTPTKKKSKIPLIISMVIIVLAITIGGIVLVNVSSTPNEPIITNIPHQEFNFSINMEF